MQSQAARRERPRMRVRLTTEQKLEIAAIARQRVAGRPAYPIEYIAALYGVTRQTIAKHSEGRREGLRKAWQR